MRQNTMQIAMITHLRVPMGSLRTSRTEKGGKDSMHCAFFFENSECTDDPVQYLPASNAGIEPVIILKASQQRIKTCYYKNTLAFQHMGDLWIRTAVLSVTRNGVNGAWTLDITQPGNKNK